MKLYKWEGFCFSSRKHCGSSEGLALSLSKGAASSYSCYLIFFPSWALTNPINPFWTWVFVCAETALPNESVQQQWEALLKVFFFFISNSTQFPQQRPAPPMQWTTTWRRPLTRMNMHTSRRPKRVWRPSTVRECPRYSETGIYLFSSLDIHFNKCDVQGKQSIRTKISQNRKWQEKVCQVKQVGAFVNPSWVSRLSHFNFNCFL